MRFLAFLPLFLAAALSAQTHQADIVIYGGTSAGVIAGIQAAKLGKKVIIVEAGQHIGGSLPHAWAAGGFPSLQTM